MKDNSQTFVHLCDTKGTKKTDIGKISYKIPAPHWYVDQNNHHNTERKNIWGILGQGY